MKILTAAYYEFLKNVRDIKMIAILLFFPIMTVYILGSAIGTLYTADIEAKIPIGVFVEEEGPISNELRKFLDNDVLKDRITTVPFSQKEAAQQAVSNGQIDVFIQLKEDQQAISVSGNKNVEFIESLMNSFVSSFNSASTVLSISKTPIFSNSDRLIERIHYTKNEVSPEIIDYYSVLTLLQNLVLGSILGIYIITKNPNTDMHIRVYSLPISKWSLVCGRMLGSVTYLFLAAVSVMLFTKYVYSANWNGNIFIITGTLFTFCLIAVGIGLLVGILVKNSAVALMLVLLLMMFFGTVSGSITPATISEVFSVISPNHHAKQLLFGTIYGYSNDIMLQSALWLGGFIIIIFSSVAILIGRSTKDGHLSSSN